MPTDPSNFVLRLCLEGTVLPFYAQPMTNLKSGRAITVPALPHATFPRTEADIPSYLGLGIDSKKYGLEMKRTTAYPGYMVDLTEFENIETLFNSRFGRNSRKNFRAKMRKLESDHTISYAFFHGSIEKEEYNRLFTCCYHLMEERFREKKIFNRFLPDWKSYHQLFYPKILRGEASLFVIYDGARPITLTLNFHRGDIIFSFIQIYDTDYARYSLGDIAMYKNLEWAYQNEYTLWDTSKGATENKVRWCNLKYEFEYHIFFKPDSFGSRLMMRAKLLAIQSKQWLRNIGVIGGILQLDRIYYYTRARKLRSYDWKSA